MQEMFLLRIALHFGTYNDFDFILLEIISLLHEFFFQHLDQWDATVLCQFFTVTVCRKKYM